MSKCDKKAKYIIKFELKRNEGVIYSRLNNKLDELASKLEKIISDNPTRGYNHHITLEGPFKIKKGINESDIVNYFFDACFNNSGLRFKLAGLDFKLKYDSDNNPRIVSYVKVKPSKELYEFRSELHNLLNNYIDTKPYDDFIDFLFHLTILNNIPITNNRVEQVVKFNYENRLSKRREYVIPYVSLYRTRQGKNQKCKTKLLAEFNFLTREGYYLGNNKGFHRKNVRRKLPENYIKRIINKLWNQILLNNLIIKRKYGH